MAIFYPSNVHDFHHSEGEELVYKALHRLPDSYVVFYSYRWLGTVAQRRSEGEADFVVLQPKKGILSIEVKAGDIDYRGGQWVQVNRRIGEEKMIDPLGQAAESQHRISDFLHRSGLPRLPLMGRAVWFTSVAVSDRIPFPLEVSPDIVLDEASLSDPESALERCFAFWRKNFHYAQYPELSQVEFSRMISLLMPEFHLTRTIHSTNLKVSSSFVQLTRQQAAVLDFLAEQRTAAIHGLAGTGKTLLAVEKARRLAAEGRKVLYICYNEFLLEHIRHENGDVPADFHNVRSLSEKLMGKLDSPEKQILAFEEWFKKDFNDDDWPYEDIVVMRGRISHRICWSTCLS